MSIHICGKINKGYRSEFFRACRTIVTFLLSMSQQKRIWNVTHKKCWDFLREEEILFRHPHRSSKVLCVVSSVVGVLSNCSIIFCLCHTKGQNMNRICQKYSSNFLSIHYFFGDFLMMMMRHKEHYIISSLVLTLLLSLKCIS